MRPSEVHVDGVLVARTLVDLKKSTAVLRVLNVTQEQKAIRRGATLASCEPVACVTTGKPPQPTGDVGVARMASTEVLSPHLELLCNHYTEGLSVSEETACQLLCELPLTLQRSKLLRPGPNHHALRM